MDRKTVKEMLVGAAEKDYIEIIAIMTELGHETEKIVIDWCKKNNKAQTIKAIEVELENLWEEAQAIISDFNEYGGGPDDEEEKAAVMHDDMSGESYSALILAGARENSYFPVPFSMPAQ